MSWKLDSDTIRFRRNNLNQRFFPSERAFLKALKSRGYNRFFRRNYPLLDRYFGDFVWRRIKLVVEIDGASHRGKEEYDAKRDAEIRAAGYQVVRIAYPFSPGALDAFFEAWGDKLMGSATNKKLIRFRRKQKEKQNQNEAQLSDLRRRQIEFDAQIKARKKAKKEAMREAKRLLELKKSRKTFIIRRAGVSEKIIQL